MLDSSQLVRHLTRKRAATSIEDALPTGSVPLDILTGGGWPAGSISAIYGPPESDTRVFGYRAIAAAERAYPGRPVILCTTDFDIERALRMGIRADTLLVTSDVEAALQYSAQTVLAVLEQYGEFSTPPRCSDATSILILPIRRLVQSQAHVEIEPQGRHGWGWARLVRAPGPPQAGFGSDLPVCTASRGFISELLDTAVELGVVIRNGYWYSYGDVKLGAGWESAVMSLLRDTPLITAILAAVADIAPVHPRWRQAYMDDAACLR